MTNFDEVDPQQSGNNMALKKLGISIAVCIVAVAVIYGTNFSVKRSTLHSSYELADEYLQIPQTDFELKTIKGWESLVSERQVLLSEVLWVGSSPEYWVFPEVEFHKYINPDDRVDNFIEGLDASDNYEKPTSYRVNDVDIYISKYIGPETEEDKIEILVKALIIYDRKGALFHGWGSSSEIEEAEKILVSMLATVRVRK